MYRRRKTTQSNYGVRQSRSHWGIGLIGGLILVALLFIAISWIGHPFYPATGPYYYGGLWFFFPFGFIFFFFFVFFIARLLFWPWAWGWRRGYWYRHDEAYDILRQRYARGEITKDQYDQMTRDLEQRR